MFSSYIYSAYGDKYDFQIEPKATVYDLKIYLETKYGFSSKNINLIFKNKFLNDSMILDSIDLNQFPEVIIESIDISESHELKDKNKNQKEKLFPDLFDAALNTVNIVNLNQIGCARFTLCHSFTRNIPVTFLTLDSTNRNALMNSTTTMDEIYNLMYFDRSQFCLYSIRKILYNNEKLSDIGIYRQCFLRATSNIKQDSNVLKEFTVCHANDNPFFIPAHDNLYVSELKKYISINNLTVTPDVIALFYSNILLNDKKKISYYRIPNKSVLIYSILSAGTLKLDLVNSLHVHTVYTFQIKFPQIKKFQDMIESSSSVPVKEMFLFFNNILIKDTNISFSDLTKKIQIEIELRTKKDPFFLIQPSKNSDTFYKIDVNRGDTVLNIKKEISDLFNVLIGDQLLIYKKIVLNDSLLIEECGVEYGSVLELNLIPTPPTFPISIFYKSQELKFEVHKDLYVRDLKQLISGKTKDDLNEIELAIQPKRLDDNTSLADLPNNGELKLFVCPIYRAFNVNVVTFNNDNFVFVVFPEMTINIFKQMLDIVLGQLHQQFTVFFNGKQISDEKTFQNIGVAENSTIYVLQQ